MTEKSSVIVTENLKRLNPDSDLTVFTLAKIGSRTRLTAAWDTAVGITTCYGLDGPGVEFLWGRDFPHPSTPALGPHNLLYNMYRVIPGR